MVKGRWETENKNVTRAVIVKVYCHAKTRILRSGERGFVWFPFQADEMGR